MRLCGVLVCDMVWWCCDMAWCCQRQVLDQLEISKGNFSVVAHALKAHGGRASFGHAKASPRWLQVSRPLRSTIADPPATLAAFLPFPLFPPLFPSFFFFLRSLSASWALTRRREPRARTHTHMHMQSPGGTGVPGGVAGDS